MIPMIVQTDSDIRRVINNCCSVCDQEEISEQIDFSFVEETPSGSTVTSKAKPKPIILINKSLWRVSDNHHRKSSLESEVCYILACSVMNRKIKRGGPEWRYFAFEIGLIEVDTEPKVIESFTLLSEW